MGGGGGGGGWSGGGGRVRQTEASQTETEREDLNFTRGDVYNQIKRLLREAFLCTYCECCAGTTAHIHV